MLDDNSKKKLNMTVGEIAKSFREAKDKSKQIQILAELNPPCTKEDIMTILKESGIDGRCLPRERKKKCSYSKSADGVGIGEDDTEFKIAAITEYIDGFKLKRVELKKQIEEIDKILEDISRMTIVN